MAPVTTLESGPASGATLERGQAPFNPFTDATVWRPAPFEPRILIKALPTLTRTDGRLEISDAPGVPPIARERLEGALARINELLESPETVDVAALDTGVIARALGAIGGAIASLDLVTEIFPLADGGVMFRWRTQRGAVEAEFDADGDAIVLIEDTAHDERQAGYFADLWTRATHWLQGR